MSDHGEKTCPLCAEEMDLTDQQLKPCKCGYQLCVWCWHHIVDMAEKDQIEGRCPACRTPYDKEKIVGMTVNCDSLVSEGNMERKKIQKSKSKPSEGRKQLTSVRVIQRNLVYIVGLPLNLADEDILQHIEYFGQYGKVLKVFHVPNSIWCHPTISKQYMQCIYYLWKRRGGCSLHSSCSWVYLGRQITKGMFWDNQVLSCMAEKCGVCQS